MSAAPATHAGITPGSEPLLEVRDVAKHYGNVVALTGVSAVVRPHEVTCVLGDNGAGKSTLIKILAGAHQPDAGEYLVDGEPVRFESPRDALDRGIATVYQDLAMIPLMAVWRNFFLGAEPTRGWGPLRRFDIDRAKRTTREELAKMGIDLRDVDQPAGTLSGGERQSVAIARAVYFGAKVLILDEPTSALGVKQAGVVLRYIVAARDRGLGVVFITHNPHHAYPVGDRFLILNRGRSQGCFEKAEVSREELTRQMAGGAELEALSHDLEAAAATAADPEVARELKESAARLTGGDGTS
jgi:simple sugar transport system ATP-binding protein